MLRVQHFRHCFLGRLKGFVTCVSSFPLLNFHILLCEQLSILFPFVLELILKRPEELHIYVTMTNFVIRIQPIISVVVSFEIGWPIMVMGCPMGLVNSFLWPSFVLLTFFRTDRHQPSHWKIACLLVTSIRNTVHSQKINVYNKISMSWHHLGTKKLEYLLNLLSELNIWGVCGKLTLNTSW